MSESLERVQGEGGGGQRSHGQSDEGQFVIVAGDAVEADAAAGSAAMDERPFAVASGGHGDGFHLAAATGGAIAGVTVQVYAPEAVGAMVAVPGAGRCPVGGGDVASAVGAAEAGVIGMQG